MQQKRKYYRTPIDGLSEFRMQQLGLLLREYRRETFLSRDEFSQVHNFSRSLLERVENGKSCNLHTYLRLANIYGIPVWQLFEGIE